jgi:hypothetical protein
MTPGGMNSGLIWKIFASMIMPVIGPSITSRRIKAKVLSKIPKSFEKLLRSLPLGVTSK